ncbi:MAG: hypothetical protein GY928_14795 [Colwellia sp.]|nr:hypothetical protein [Colwellia sp.]
MDFDKLTNEELAVVKFHCDESLLYFTRFWYRVLRGNKFILNWHQEDICRELERLQNYELEYLGINIPPRFSKTELAAVNFIARGIGMNPTSNWLYITASDELRSETSIRIRDIVSHPYFNRMYGVGLKKDQQGKNLWRTTQGGGLKTATIFGQITGFGAGQMIDHSDGELLEYIRLFEGCIVLDDVNKTDDAAVVNATNTKVMRVLGNTVLSRKNSNDTPIVNIQQRAGIEDATAYFMELFGESDKAKFLVYPIIYKGESLWPWKMPMNKIEELKNNPKTKHTFESQYMQNPMPLEGLMYPDKFKTYKEIPKEKLVENGKEVERLQGWCIGIIDSADKGDDNFSAPMLQIIGNRLYLKDVIFNKNELITQEDPIKAKTKENSVVKWVVETNHAGNYFSGRLRRILENTQVFGQWSSSNKMARIIANAGFLSKYLYVPENPSGEMLNFIDQCYRLLKVSKDKDDAPDSLSAGTAHLEKYYHLFRDSSLD